MCTTRLLPNPHCFSSQVVPRSGIRNEQRARDRRGYYYKGW
ncbi:hypothetical protein [Nocardia sp. BMG111209]|nr:hypothetical protein [Nocardia sp. BMG111209]